METLSGKKKDSKMTALNESMEEDAVDKKGDDNDDMIFGKVRERRDFSALEICLKPILPTPFREYSFLERTGWRYHPRAQWMDRLGSVRTLEGMPMDDDCVLPANAWRNHSKEVVGSSSSIEMEGGDDQIMDVQTHETDSLQSQGSQHEDRKRKLSPSNVEEEFGTLLSSLSVSHKKTATHSSNATVATTTTASTMATTGTASTVGTTSISLDESAFNASQSKSLISQPQIHASSTNTTNPNPLAKATTPTAPSSTASASSKNAATNSDPVAPKAALYQYYGKKPRKIQLNNAKQYLTWDNGKPTHEQLFTALFLCPLTNEIFMAGPWQPSTNGGGSSSTNSIATPLYQQMDDLYWYPRKVMAEHAVAARCWDCLLMRDGSNNVKAFQLSQSDPYWPSQQPAIPWECIPKRILHLLPEDQVPASLKVADTTTLKSVDAAATNITPSDDQSVVTTRTDAAVVPNRTLHTWPRPPQQFASWSLSRQQQPKQQQYSGYDQPQDPHAPPPPPPPHPLQQPYYGEQPQQHPQYPSYEHQQQQSQYGLPPPPPPPPPRNHNPQYGYSGSMHHGHAQRHNNSNNNDRRAPFPR